MKCHTFVSGISLEVSISKALYNYFFCILLGWKMILIVTLLMPCHRLIKDISTMTWDQNQLLSFKINLANFIQTQFIHLWFIYFHWRYSVIQGVSSSISSKKFELSSKGSRFDSYIKLNNIFGHNKWKNFIPKYFHEIL